MPKESAACGVFGEAIWKRFRKYNHPLESAALRDWGCDEGEMQ